MTVIIGVVASNCSYGKDMISKSNDVNFICIHLLSVFVIARIIPHVEVHSLLGLSEDHVIITLSNLCT